MNPTNNEPRAMGQCDHNKGTKVRCTNPGTEWFYKKLLCPVHYARVCRHISNFWNNATDEELTRGATKK